MAEKLLPLPLELMSAEDMRQMYKKQELSKVSKVKERCKQDKESNPRGQRHLHAGITLRGLDSNFMKGHTKDKGEAEGLWLRRSPSFQREALRHRHMDAEKMGLEKVEETFSGAWLAELGSETMSYEGVTEAKTHGLSTWEVESALRPKSMAGWGDVLEEYPSGITARLSDPWSLMQPRSGSEQPWSD